MLDVVSLTSPTLASSAHATSFSNEPISPVCKVNKRTDRLNTGKGVGASLEEVGLGRTAQTQLR